MNEVEVSDTGRPDRRAQSARKALVHVAEALRDLRYGEVTVVVQDGVVVQVERTVKQRLARNSAQQP